MVYVTFAGQAGMTKIDVKFLDENLAHVDPRRCIIAVNKCDLQPNAEAIRSHINRIRTSGDPRMASLFGDDEGIVLVSGLGGLIASLQNAGRPLRDGDMRFHARKLSRNGYLDAEQHGVDKLRDLVERRIIANKATNIIDSHQAMLDSVLECAERRLETEVEALGKEFELVDTSIENRDKQGEEASKAIVEIHNLFRNIRIEFENSVHDELVELDGVLRSVSDAVCRDTRDGLERLSRVNSLPSQARWIIHDRLRNRREKIIKKTGGIDKAYRDISER